MRKSMESEVEDLMSCLECQEGRRFKDQIENNVKKYNEFIKSEIEKLPDNKPNDLLISYCMGAIDQLKDISTLTERALIFMSQAQKANNLKLAGVYNHKAKLEGRS